MSAGSREGAQPGEGNQPLQEQGEPRPVDDFTFHVPPDCNEPVDVIHADADVLVVNKPAGLLSVPGRVVKDCVLNRMLADFPDVTIVHRLDLDTSGLLVLARSRVAAADLNRQFRERLVRKEYAAEVFGHVKDDVGEIDLPIAPDPDNRPKQRIHMMNGKAAKTLYEVIERKSNSTLLLLKPVTGRTHQLRIHLANIGHPILGCDLYAHPMAFEAGKRLHLHARILGFDHPQSAKRQLWTSETPF